MAKTNNYTIYTLYISIACYVRANMIFKHFQKIKTSDQKLIGQAKNIFDELLQTEQIYVNKLHVIKRIKDELVNKLRNENYSNAAVKGIDIRLKISKICLDFLETKHAVRIRFRTTFRRTFRL